MTALRALTIALALLALAAVPRGTHAGQWVPIGPELPDVFVLATDPRDPRIVYAGGRNIGVFRSVDGGASWRAARDGLPPHDILALVVDPVSPATLYAGTDFGVFRTVDGGERWSLASIDLQTSVTALAIDPSDPAVLFAGAEWGGGIYRSADRGATWTQAWTEAEAPPILALAIDPGSRTVYALRGVGGVLRSTDGGASWLTGDLPGPRGVSASGALAIASGRLFAARDARVFRSDDAGATWTASVIGAETDYWVALAIDPNEPATLYAAGSAGVYATVDGGASWARLPGLPRFAGWCQALVADPSAPGTLLVGTPGGMLRTADGGRSWETRHHGMSGGQITALAVDPQDPARLYASPYYGGVMRTSDGGASWTRTSFDLLSVLVYDILVDPTRPSTLYAGRFFASAAGGGVSKSTDGGGSWAFARDGLPTSRFANDSFESVTRLVMAPDDARRLYAVGGTVYETRDGGMSWSPAGTGLRGIRSLAIDPTQPRRLLVGGSGGTIYESLDGGATWRERTAIGADVFALAVDPLEPSTVYAGSWEGIHQSLDGGTTWSRVHDVLTVDLTIETRLGGVVYADSSSGGVYRSSDCGASWQPINDGLFSYTGDSVYGRLLLDPLVPGRLYRLSQGGGVYRYDPSRPEEAPQRIRDGEVRLHKHGLLLRGALAVDPATALAPDTDGFRMRVESPAGGELLALDVPGGAGWRATDGGWTYLGSGRAGTRGLRLRLQPSDEAPGQLRFTLRARTQTAIPLRKRRSSLTMVLDVGTGGRSVKACGVVRVRSRARDRSQGAPAE